MLNPVLKPILDCVGRSGIVEKLWLSVHWESRRGFFFFFKKTVEKKWKVYCSDYYFFLLVYSCFLHLKQNLFGEEHCLILKIKHKIPQYVI